MDVEQRRRTLKKKLKAFIQDSDWVTPDLELRDALIHELCAWQADSVLPYKRIIQHHRTQHPQPIPLWPAVPTDVFRFTRLCAHRTEKDIRFFSSSGTTAEQSSHHYFRDLELYQLAALRAAKIALFADVERMTQVILAPSESEAPHSSLSFMLARFVQTFGNDRCVHVWQEGNLNISLLEQTLDESIARGAPVALLGTSFAFVHALDHLDRNWNLPIGSRIMQTGGYKGRSREVGREELKTQLCERFGVSQSHLIAEYGMTELSSQMYERSLMGSQAMKDGPDDLFWAPPWVAIRIVDPRDAAELRVGEVGLIEISDLANLDSACKILTSDLGVKNSDGGFRLLGRAPGSVLRGCSLNAETLFPMAEHGQ